MNASIKLGKIWGIPIGLNASWFLIFGLVTWSLATAYFPMEYPQLTGGQHWILGLVTSLLFFGSVLAHELGHAWAALRERIPVRSITLFIFGGVAHIGQEPRSPGVEFKVAIAGPVVSLALALVFQGLYFLDQEIAILAAPSAYLARINLLLALFNMIPGFPLDGGRVLRSIVWRLTNNFGRATRIASVTGQVVAFGFIGLGIVTIFTGNFMNGLWLAFIGWFLQNAAAGAYAQTQMQESLTGVTVEQVMGRDIVHVPSLVSIYQLVQDRVLHGGQRTFVVSDNGQLAGVLTLGDIARVPQQKWRFTTTEQAMVPLNRIAYLTPQTELLEALQSMEEANVTQLPVVDQGEVVGVLTREQILHYLRTRAELGI